MGHDTYPGSGIKPAAFDILERSFLFLLLGWFLVRLVPSLEAEPYNVLVLFSEAFTVCLVLMRKPGPMATTVYAWAVAIVGTCAAMLVTPGGHAVISVSLGATLMLCGLILSVAAKLYLNRSFGIVPANRGVKSSGPYRLVRHPMYLGYFVTHLGFVLLHLSLWNVVVYLTCWFALVLRIRSEEQFLSKDERYQVYAAGVRYRLMPGLY